MKVNTQNKTKNKFFNPTASLTYVEPGSEIGMPQGTINLGMGMSQNVIESILPSKKRGGPKGELINPNAKKRKLNKGAKFI